MVMLQQQGYELMETHDGEGAVVVVDYMMRAGPAYVRGSSAYTAGKVGRWAGWATVGGSLRAGWGTVV
jgi:hypothetical protein